MNPRRTCSTAGPVLMALVMLLAACGNDEESEDRGDRQASASQSASTSVAEPAPGRPEAAYRAWVAALEAHDAAGACARHAPELTIELRQRAILLDRAELGDPCTGFVAVLWEDPAREYDPTSVEPTQVTDEDAFLAVDYPGVDETVTMARRHGAWYVADTSPRASGAADPAAWVDRWCDLAVGMHRDEVIDRMGAPSGEYSVDNGGEPQLWWATRQYDFRAYLDRAGTVTELVGDYDRLGAADRDALPCPELR